MKTNEEIAYNVYNKLVILLNTEVDPDVRRDFGTAILYEALTLKDAEYKKEIERCYRISADVSDFPHHLMNAGLLTPEDYQQTNTNEQGV